jgi:hypothetical protein
MNDQYTVCLAMRLPHFSIPIAGRQYILSALMNMGAGPARHDYSKNAAPVYRRSNRKCSPLRGPDSLFQTNIALNSCSTPGIALYAMQSDKPNCCGLP